MHNPLHFALIADLFGALETDGMPVGTDLHLRIQTLLRALPDAVGPEDMKTLLAPLLCKNKEEQERFYQLFDGSWKRVQEMNILEKTDDKKEAGRTENQEKRRKKWREWSVVGSLLLIAVFLVLKFSTEDKKLKEIRTVLDVEVGGHGQYLFDTLLKGQHDRAFAWNFEVPDTAIVEVTIDSASRRINYRGISAGIDSANLYYQPEQGRERQHKVIFNVADTMTIAGPEDPEISQDCVYVQRQLPYYPRDLSQLYPPQPTLLQQFLSDYEWPVKTAAMLSGGLLLWLLARWAARKRRKLIAEHQPNSKPPYAWNIRTEGEQEVAFGDQYHNLLNMLRRRESGESWRLDMPETIRATIRKGGMPEFRYARHTRPAEYLLLLDTHSARDHRTQLFNQLYKNFRTQEVIVERYFYDGDPRLCWNETHPGGLTLRELQYNYPHSRLLLVGNNYQLLNPQTGRLAKWTNLFTTWSDRAVLSPQPIHGWGRRERALGEQFYVLPAALSGLREAIERFDTDDRKETDITPRNFPDAHYEPIELIDNDLIKTLQTAYGNSGQATSLLTWIAACAVYPELHWDLTLYLGQLLSTEENTLLSAEYIAQICRLPWFTEGKIPDDARKVLLTWIEEQHPDTLLRIREGLHNLLKDNPPSDDSAAYDDYALNMALNEWQFTKDKRRRKALEKEVAARLAAGQTADFTVVKVLDRPRSPLDFVVPDAWRKYVYHQGAPLLGMRAWIWALPFWMAMSGLVGWWQPDDGRCKGISVPGSGAENPGYCLENISELMIWRERQAVSAIAENDLATADSLVGRVVATGWKNWKCSDQFLSFPQGKLNLDGLLTPADSIMSFRNRFEAFMTDAPLDSNIWVDFVSFYQNTAVAYFNQGVSLRDSLLKQEPGTTLLTQQQRSAGRPESNEKEKEPAGCDCLLRARVINALLPDTLQLWYIREAAKRCESISDTLRPAGVKDIVLRGQTTDAESKGFLPPNVLADATITAKGLKAYWLSKGQFRVDVPGDWKSPVVIIVAAPGYRTQTVTVQPGSFHRNVVISMIREVANAMGTDTTIQKLVVSGDLNSDEQEVQKIIESVLQVTGISNMKITARVSNSVNNVTSGINRGEKYIIYNPVFLNKLSGWGKIGVIAHEIGHQILGHDLSERSLVRRKQMELEADKFMGGIMARMGATSEEALSPLESLKGTGEISTHPSPDARRQAVMIAYNNEIQKSADTDGDGVPDNQDNCPKIKGLKNLKGCPAGNLYREHIVTADETLRSIAARYGLSAQEIAVANGMDINDKPITGKVILIPVKTATDDKDGDEESNSEPVKQLTPLEFVKKYKDAAYAAEKQTGLSAVVLLAQAALESGWGSKVVGNMFFGVKDPDKGKTGKGQLIVTTEYLKNSDQGHLFPEVISVEWNEKRQRYKYTVRDWFRKYDSPEECFLEHAMLFKKNPRYDGVFKIDPFDYAEQIREIQKAGYASAPNYADVLIAVARTIVRNMEN